MVKAITVDSLYKSYGDFLAVKGISFDVEEGAFFAFLGPNGAGKSTTISILCSLLDKDSGSVSIFGKDPQDARSEIGMVFQDNKLDNRLTVRENLMVRGSLYGFKKEELSARVEEALKRTDSMEFADRQYSKLSGGQKRRAEIARAIIHDPKVLLLDEPTAGLDPQTRMLIWNNVQDLKRSGMTVFLTTHYMEEAADADDVVIINRGEIVAHGTPSVLKERYSSDYIEVLPKDIAVVRSKLDAGGIQYIERSDVLRISLEDTMKAIPIIEMLKDDMESFEVRTGTLDDAFVTITGGDVE
ncbi:MAG: ATP-binding cassette domain-containing protein [Candidatus Methanomethylophilaceae archaeon]|nr:ATP-binding cassette domain-containing protein [Candidatus Methanomethylophilaceae archaeon]